MQFPDGMGRQGTFLTDVAMHQFHGRLVVVQDGHQQVRIDVGVLGPDGAGHKAVFQQRGGGVPVQCIQAFQETGFNRPEALQPLDALSQPYLHIRSGAKLVPAGLPPFHQVEVIRPFRGRQTLQGPPCMPHPGGVGFFQGPGR